MYYSIADRSREMYYTSMVQPKTPPLSVRLGEARLAEIDAYALKHGLKRHAAVLELIDVGLKGVVRVATQRPTPKPVPGSDAAARKAERATKFTGTTATGEPLPERRPIQKTPKR